MPRGIAKSKRYGVLVADPPWLFDDKLPGKGRGAMKYYPCMDTTDLQLFPLPPMRDDAYLFLWRVAAMPMAALRVCEAWDFVPKTELIWRKQTATGKRWFGMGRHLRAEHETCIVATRGSPKPLTRSMRSVFDAPALKSQHSAKPDAFYKLVEDFALGPYIELFARRRRRGWTCLGNEL